MDEKEFNAEFNMSADELMAALKSGENAEDASYWVPRIAAILLTITVYNPDIITENPEEIKNALRIVTSRMPSDVLAVATLSLVRIQDAMKDVSPEMYTDIQDAFKDFDPDAE